MSALISVRNKLCLLGFLVTTVAFEVAVAQEPNKTGTGSERKMFIQFENELVKGQEDKPSLEYIFQRDEFKYKKMIKLRDDFIGEVRKGKGDFGGN